MSTISTNWGEAPKPEFASSNPSGSYGLRDLFGKSNKTDSKASTNEVQTPEREIQDTFAAEPLPYEPVHGNAANHRTLRGDSVSHTTTVMHGFTLGDGHSTRSNDSQQMIIRKDTMYSVDHA